MELKRTTSKATLDKVPATEAQPKPRDNSPETSDSVDSHEPVVEDTKDKPLTKKEQANLEANQTGRGGVYQVDDAGKRTKVV